MSERSESNGAEGSRTLDLCIAKPVLGVVIFGVPPWFLAFYARASIAANC
jgi:hypothetical protein